MRTALRERRALIEQRADALVDDAVRGGAPWLAELGGEPSEPQRAQEWRHEARVVAAYRDRYGIADGSALGSKATTAAQPGDASKARAALVRARQLAAGTAERESQTLTMAKATVPRL